MGDGNAEIGAKHGYEEALDEGEDVSAADDQHEVADREGEADDCEQQHEYQEGSPQILRLEPYQDFFGRAFKCHEEGKDEQEEGDRQKNLEDHAPPKQLVYFEA